MMLAAELDCCSRHLLLLVLLPDGSGHTSPTSRARTVSSGYERSSSQAVGFLATPSCRQLACPPPVTARALTKTESRRGTDRSPLHVFNQLDLNAAT